jgi:endonuclease/exonuclease/phosphatase family metal-dependent hydrolase
MAQRELRVTTWNVLHRVHAVNWKEAPVAAFPDERVRIERISVVVAGWLASDVDAVCLQEVSGDQLASLRRAASAAVIVFEHTYPRLPRLRGSGAPQLDDASEHLVTIVRDRSAKQLDARTFASDPGKGLLALDLDSAATLVNTHVTFGDRRTDQLVLLASIATAPAIVVGDFNASADVVGAALGGTTSILDRPTRIATDEHDARVIDHVVVLGGTLASAAVLDGQGLSDHNPVTARVLV